jgi:hypothetical protein
MAEKAAKADLSDGLLARLAKNDVKKGPPLVEKPTPEVQSKRNLRARLEFEAAKAERAAPPHHRRVRVDNSAEAALRASYAAHEGKTVEEFREETFIPPSVAERCARTTSGSSQSPKQDESKESSGSSVRDSISRAFEQHGDRT